MIVEYSFVKGLFLCHLLGISWLPDMSILEGENSRGRNVGTAFQEIGRQSGDEQHVAHF